MTAKSVEVYTLAPVDGAPRGDDDEQRLAANNWQQVELELRPSEVAR
jgi:hypothetical protein